MNYQDILGSNHETTEGLFGTVMEQTPIEDLDTDVLLELILRGYDAAGPGSGFIGS